MWSIELWEQQESAFEFVSSRDAAALLCEQRTGKTYISLRVMESDLRMYGQDYVVVVICLLNNRVSTWVTKIQELLPQLAICEGLDQLKSTRGPRALLVHYEQLPSLIGKLSKYKRIKRVIIDEAHRLYNRGSAQSKAASRLSWVPLRLILTGTPLEKKPTDLWAQFRFLAPEVLGKNYSNFENQWLDWRKINLEESGARPGGPAWQRLMLKQRILKSKAEFKWELLGEFLDLISPLCYRLEKSDVGILPPEVHQRGVTLSPRLARIYRAMRERGIADLPDGTRVMAPLAATKLMKLRQLASGFIYDEDHSLHWLSTSKQQSAIRLFESSPKPVVIFCSFIPEVHYIHRSLERLGYDVRCVWGGTKQRDRPGAWAAFQAGQLDAIVCQTRAGGVGVDLWKANRAIVTSMEYSSIVWDQARSRLDAKHKRVPSVFTVLSSRDTVDEDLFDLVQMKGQTTKQTLSQLKRRHTVAKNTETKATEAAKPLKAEAPKYGVQNLAEDLKLEPASVRILLRKSSLTKAGGVWGWATKADYESALKALKALRTEAKAPAAEKPAKAPAAEKPAKAPAAEKPAKAKKAA